MSQKWIPKTLDEACKRAAGRRRYHAKRRRMRDKRQLLILGILVELNWPHYGIGRMLAKALLRGSGNDQPRSRKYRASLILKQELSEKFADAIIRRLVAARIHPRRPHSWTYKYIEGFHL